MIRNPHESPGRRLDRLLFTRPLFETLLAENEMGWPDRMTVIAHTLRAVFIYRRERCRAATGELVDKVLFRVIGGGRVPRRGMKPVLGVGDFTWYQATHWDAAQRARRVLGRIPRKTDCTALYCGWRKDLKPGEPLPVFVLLDPDSRLLEVAYADVGEDGVAGLSPGVGDDLRPSDPRVLPALGALVTWLGLDDMEDRLHRFTGT